LVLTKKSYLHHCKILSMPNQACHASTVRKSHVWLRQTMTEIVRLLMQIHRHLTYPDSESWWVCRHSNDIAMVMVQWRVQPHHKTCQCHQILTKQQHTRHLASTELWHIKRFCSERVASWQLPAITLSHWLTARPVHSSLYYTPKL